MSLRILKSGLLDTIQDGGRIGYQHLGINPCGAMDLVAMQMANLLVGNKNHEAVLEMHFPAAEILFEQDAIIALSGADFGAIINSRPVSILHPILVQKNSTLRFTKNKSGARCYIAILGGFVLKQWLGSKSTNLKVGAGGYNGRALQKNDVLPLNNTLDLSSQNLQNNFLQLTWSANANGFYASDVVSFFPGEAFESLHQNDKEKLLNNEFIIASKSDRMAYYTEGIKLTESNFEERISSAVTRGTMQLLPDGQLIILMADHQTTGGYPVVGCVATSSFPSLAQMPAGKKIRFKMTDHNNAEINLLKQHADLLRLKNACNFRLQNFLSK